MIRPVSATDSGVWGLGRSRTGAVGQTLWSRIVEPGRLWAQPLLARQAVMTPWVRNWIPAWAMMALIFVLSSISGLPSLPGGVDDSVPHAVEYSVLAALLLRGLVGARWRRVTVWAACAAALLATLYGVTDELHQWFVPGRTAEVADLVADASGAVVAVSLIWTWQRAVRAPRHTETGPGQRDVR